MDKQKIAFGIIMYSISALLILQGLIGLITGELKLRGRTSGILNLTGDWALIVSLIFIGLGLFVIDLASGIPIQRQFEKLGKKISKFVNKE